MTTFCLGVLVGATVQFVGTLVLIHRTTTDSRDTTSRASEGDT